MNFSPTGTPFLFENGMPNAPQISPAIWAMSLSFHSRGLSNEQSAKSDVFSLPETVTECEPSENEPETLSTNPERHALPSMRISTESPAKMPKESSPPVGHTERENAPAILSSERVTLAESQLEKTMPLE